MLPHNPANLAGLLDTVHNEDLASPSAPPTDTLVLVPTREEARELTRFAPKLAVRLCGFGPVAAAAAGAQALFETRPRRVLLLGIAGTYDPARWPVGSAASFESVALDGVGAGEGSGRLGPKELGFPQWRDEAKSVDVHSELDIVPLAPDAVARRLLTVCACSDTVEMAGERAGRFDAQAEDMEAFGVALACQLADVPLAVVRGVSNVAGDRDVRSWRIPEAIESAWQLAERALAKPLSGGQGWNEA